MSRADDRNYTRLATVARRRRAELGLALNDKNAKAGGLSNRTWQRVEKGLPIRETNYVKIDRLLHWAPGSCLLVLEGGEPVPTEEAESAPGVQKSVLPPDVLDAEAMSVVQLALLATAKGTTAEEIREISERVVQDLRKHGLM